LAQHHRPDYTRGRPRSERIAPSPFPTPTKRRVKSNDESRGRKPADPSNPKMQVRRTPSVR
jgi:hypothetical protein